MTDMTEVEIDGLYTRDDVITINRADLPDVCTHPSGLLIIDDSNYHDKLTAAEWRESANRRLALAEFVEARDKAAEEAEAAKQGKRRNELAELFSGVTGTRYGLRNRDLRNAIDYIVELEDKAHD